MSWAHSGDDEAKAEAAERARKRSFTMRFFLKAKETRAIVFLEDVNEKTFGFWQHKLKPDGRWEESEDVTCTRGVKDMPCFVCEQKLPDAKGGMRDFVRTHINVVTVVDLSPWTGQNGQVWCSKRVLLMKAKTFELLRGKNDRRGGLKMWVVSAHRAPEMKGDKDQSPSAGNDFEPLVRISDPAKPISEVVLEGGKAHPGLINPDGTPLDLKPLDYFEVFKPKLRADLEKLFKARAISDGNVWGDKGPSKPQPGGVGQDEEVIKYT